MMNAFLIRSACLLWLTVANHAKTVLQSPDDLIKSQNEWAVIVCSHNIQYYDQMLWYKQSQHIPGLKLMGYLYLNENIEPEFKDKIKLAGDAKRNGTLTINNLAPEDSAVYFCAADINANPAHFGSGTKLTVLEKNVEIKPPTVAILNETSCKEKVTLVCLAENFYPDHVSIKWTLGSREITEDVATDPYATQNETSRMFSISSRLKVPKKEFTPKNTFKCKVTFINDKEILINETAEITGTGGGGYEPEDYFKSSQTISLAYGVFIAKSALYGLVILVFVCRKGSPGKRIN